jgi:hypothetical protein
MTSEPSKRVEQIYRLAQEHASENRKDFVSSACGQDEDLRREVMALLTRDN